MSEAVFVRFLHSKVTLSPLFPYCSLWNGVILCNPHLRSGIYALPPRTETIPNLFEFIIYRRFIMGILSSICLLNLLFIPIWIYGYLFYNLGYNLILIYFLFHIIPTLATGSSFSWLLCLFDMTLSFFLFLTLPYFLVLQDAPSSSCLLPSAALESAISTKSPCFFYCRMILETKIWALGLIFPFVQVCWWQILSAFICLAKLFLWSLFLKFLPPWI